MADTSVAITAGTGTAIDTRTEATNGNHRQVVVLGDPATNAGVAPVDATTGLSVNVTNTSIPVTAASLPLPTGAATSAKQDTGNTSVASIDTKTPALGQALAAASVPVVLTAAQITTLTPVSTVTANAGTGTMAVSAASLPLPALAATSTKQSDGTQKTQIVDGAGAVIGSTTNALDVNIKSGASSGAVAQGSTTSGQTGSLIQGAVTTSAPTYTTAQTNPLSLTTAGALRTDASATTQPVSGTVSAAQSGTWTVQPGNTANTTAWKVDGSAVTQPVSGTVTANAGTGTMAVSLASVPSHAVTNAGTFATQESQIIADNAAFTDGTSKVFPTGYIYDEVAGTALTENDVAAARINVNRAQVGTLEDGATRGRYATVTASNALKVDNSGVTQPVSGTVSITANSAVNTAQINGVTPLMGNGATGTGSQRVTIASDNTAFSVNATLSAETTKVIGTVNPGNTANTTPWLVQDSPATSGGLSKFHLVSAASTNATNVKASAGQVYAITVFNLNAAARYLKFHNTAGTPTAGTASTEACLIPGATTGTGLVLNIDKGIAFSTGIAITTTTGIADADTAAVAASELLLNIYYK